MKVRLILPLVKFFDAVDHSTRLDDADLKYRYKMAARRCAFWYRDQNFDPKIDGPQDEWWQDWISILKPEHPKGKDGVCWGRVSNIRRDNIDKLKTGSALIFAAAIHQRFHATPDTAAQRLAKFLDRLAFGEPVKERLGPVCEFVEKPEIQGAAALRESNKDRSLIEISGLKWTQMPANSSDRELSMDLTFDIFDQEIGGRYYVYGSKQASFRVSTYNFDVKKFYQSSRRELPEYITDDLSP